MRTIRIAVAVMALVAVPALASAQNTASANMTVTANIIKALTLSKVSAGNLDFGTVAAGTTPTAIAPASASAIKFQANGQANTAITVTFSTANLTSGVNTLTFTPSVTTFDSDVQASGVAVSTGNTTTLHTTTGDRFFWVGGNLGAIPAAQAAGTYTGSWTLTVAY